MAGASIAAFNDRRNPITSNIADGETSIRLIIWRWFAGTATKNATAATNAEW
jgi:hypothetical protein